MKFLKKNYQQTVEDFCEYMPFDNFQYSINISLKNEYIYIETPKVACSSIKATLQKIEFEDINYKPFNEHYHDRRFSPFLKPTQVGDFANFLNSSVFKFCFVRNPYTRVLSAYLDKILGNEPQKRIILKTLGLSEENINHYISFQEFVDVICDQSIYDMNSHWRVQYYQTFQSLIEYDFIGKFESLSEDLDIILSKINENYEEYITKRAPHSTGASSKLKENYTSELAGKIYEKFKIDFEYFGYDPDIKSLY